MARRLPRTVGIDPVRLLLLTSRICRDGPKWNKASGKVLFIPIEANSRICKLVKRPISFGTTRIPREGLPGWNVLLESDKLVRLCNTPISDGMIPVKKFPPSLSTCNDDNSCKLLGIVPDSRFCSMVNEFKLRIVPSVVGKLPRMLFWSNDTLFRLGKYEIGSPSIPLSPL